MNLLLELLNEIFIQVPMSLSKAILGGLKPEDQPKRFYLIWGVMTATCLTAGVGFIGLARNPLIQWMDKANPSWLLLGGYTVYLIVSTLLLMPFQYLKQEGFKKGGFRKTKFKPEQMLQGRLKAQFNQAFLGKSMKNKRNMLLSHDMRKMHTHVVGSTGAGKTDSVILPLLVQDIERGYGSLIMDAKGDYETLSKIYHHVKRIGREKDFLFFSLAYPEKSNTYNPLLRGNPTELKDKIISANVWTEEFYKKKSEETLLLLMKCLKEADEITTFQKLYELLSDEKKLRDLAKKVKDQRLKGIMINILAKFPLFQKDLSGMTADLGMIAESEFAHLLVQEKPEIDLLDAYLNKKIVYFQLNAQGYEETARRFGRIVLQDLKTISNYIQAYLPEEKRNFFPIYVDEFSNFAYEQFIEFLNKARGAHLAILIAHQSLGDLQKAGDHFVKQVLENCNIKIIMRQDDPASIETYSRISGTETKHKDTYQIEEGAFDKTKTGLGTVREVEEFRIKPNMIRELGRGEGAVIIKQPFLTDILQLDYIGETKPMQYIK